MEDGGGGVDNEKVKIPGGTPPHCPRGKLLLRDVLVVEDERPLNAALLGVDVGHADHLHARAEVAAQGHLVIDVHPAPLLGKDAHALLGRQTDVAVVRHGRGPQPGTLQT